MSDGFNYIIHTFCQVMIHCKITPQVLIDEPEAVVCSSFNITAALNVTSTPVHMSISGSNCLKRSDTVVQSQPYPSSWLVLLKALQLE